jgi:hypothetical protein
VECLLDNLIYQGNGLKNGTLLFLCDNEQAYSFSNDNINDEIDLLSLYFTNFQMNHSYRSVNNPLIRDLASRILKDIYYLNSNEVNDSFPNIIQKFENFKKAKSQMVNDFLKPIRDINSSLRGKDCILLVESSLLDKEKLEELNMDNCESLTEDNVTDTSNMLRFTSPLKFKGLEKENVALIVKNPNANNQNEIYIGITRAITNLKIYIVNE